MSHARANFRTFRDSFRTLIYGIGVPFPFYGPLETPPEPTPSDDPDAPTFYAVFRFLDEEGEDCTFGETKRTGTVEIWVWVQDDVGEKGEELLDSHLDTITDAFADLAVGDVHYTSEDAAGDSFENGGFVGHQILVPYVRWIAAA